MPDAPYVTGNDVLAYQGNANLGYGGGTNYAYNPAVQNPLAGADQSLQNALNTTSQFNQLVFNQKQREKEMQYRTGVDRQDQMLKWIMEGNSPFKPQKMKDANGNSVPIQALPGDQKQVGQDVADYVKSTMGNPVTYQFNSDLIGKVKGEHQAKIGLMAARSQLNTELKQRMAVAKANGDEEEVNRLQDHYDKQIGQYPDLNTAPLPQPYAPKKAFGMNDFYPDAIYKPKENYTEKFITNDDGSVSKMTTLNPSVMASRMDDIRSNPALLHVAADYSTTMLHQMAQYPQLEKNIDYHNAEVNKQLGWGDDNPAHFLTVDEALQTKDPAKIFYTLTGANALKLGKEGYKTAQEMQKQGLDNENIRSQMKLHDAQIEKWQKDAENDKKSGKITQWQYEDQMAKVGAAKDYNRTKGELGNLNVTITSGDTKKETKWNDISPIDPKNPNNQFKTFYEPLNKIGFDPTGFRPIKKELSKILTDAAPKVDKKDKNGKIVGTASVNPREVYQFVPPDGDWRKSKIVYVYPNEGVEGNDGKIKSTPVYAVRTAYDVYSSGKTDADKNYADDVWENGGDITSGSDDNTKSQPTIQPVNRKTIGLITYEKDANGKWFKVI